MFQVALASLYPPQLNPHQLKHAIAQTAFIIYSSITLGLIM